MTAKSFRPNVAAVIMHPSNKKVLMFRRIAKRNENSELLSDGGQLKWNWQFPQGGIDPGESEEETLFRELEEEGLQGDYSEENDVVFGDGRIDQKSMSNFVAHYPDSTLKFLMRKNLDGRPLPVGYEEIYSQWENRGLSRDA